MTRTPTRRGRGLLISAGVVLVAAFLGWLVLRHQGAGGLDLGMGSVIGWVAQGLALLVLLGGVALIARGTTTGTTHGTTTRTTPGTTRDATEGTPHPATPDRDQES